MLCAVAVQLAEFGQLVDSTPGDDDDMDQSVGWSGMSDSDDPSSAAAASASGRDASRSPTGAGQGGGRASSSSRVRSRHDAVAGMTIGEEDNEHGDDDNSSVDTPLREPLREQQQQPPRNNNNNNNNGNGDGNKGRDSAPRLGIDDDHLGSNNPHSMRPELEMWQRLSRLDPDDSTTPLEMAKKLVQHCNAADAAGAAGSRSGGNDSDTSTSSD